MRVVLSCLLSSLAGISMSTTALAIEPQAPQSLITSEESVVILARQQLDLMKKSSDASVGRDQTGLSEYYANHFGAPLWVNKNGLTNKAKLIIEEIRQADQWGLNSAQFDLPSLTEQVSTADLIDAEIALSLAILKYARHARGGRMDPTSLSLAIDRVPPLEAPRVVLDSLQSTDNPARYLQSLHPQHDQFKKLRSAYLKALSDEQKNTKLQKKSKVKLSQRLLYNMEMWRWMPRELGAKYVWSNIPEFKVRIIKNERVVHEERIVIGKTTHKTPIFSDEMETIVFHPFWGVPNSIKVKELLPSLVRGGNALTRQGLRISYAGREIDPNSVDWSQNDIRNYHVFQPPGRRNALGIVKFMFPNKHAVYMHDTPSKHLFKRNVRAFSHGCMRVRNPLKLAELVLQHDKGWERTKIDVLISNGPKNNQITLNNKLQVHVTYFTVWIDDDGKPVTMKDIYGHEKLIQMGFDGKTHLIVRKKINLDAKRRAIVANIPAQTSYQYSSNPGWRQSVFEN